MRAAFPACLLALLAWAASTGEGRVVGDDQPGFAECDAFFYGQAPPVGFPAEQVAKVCQKYRGEPRFATLYSTREKVPLFAAFRYTPGEAAGQEEQEEEQEARWLVEPQIDDPGNKQEEMMPEAEIAEALEHLGRNQALMADYADSGYERGNLNPSCLHKDDHHVATHTLTNAVPLSPPFQELWHWEVEQLVIHSLAPNCENGKDLHLLSGAIPSSLKVKDKMAVPKSVWLAACCDNGAETWSVGFIKEANAESRLEDLTLEALEKKLPAGAELFKDHCGQDRQDPKKLEAVLRSAKDVQAKKPDKPCVKKPTQSKHTQTAKEESGFLKNLCHFIVTPIWKLVKFVCYLICQLVKGVWCLLRWIVQKILCAVWTFIKGISLALLDIFICLGRVGVSILNGIAKNIYNVLMATYRILSVPVNLILDIVSFPFYTLGAIPGVLKDIASGIGGLFILVINATTSLVKGLNHVVSFLASKILPTTVF
ncbi:endonuclease domain-containing 1 protein [Thamnophis elegans]|uniref:endonuclease domain-containing 1 protein n=1 Tax=Thamnophis elegans TaxID=35005 RepID=UPI0013772E22|nr:endonuclease domain-containing 1 protein [Thamnophis elegans]